MFNFFRLSLLIFVGVASLTTSQSLLAHQQKEAVTRIIFNQRLQTIEVIHRFLIHDAEHAAKVIFGKSADIIGDKLSQKQFSDYVIDNFQLSRISAADDSGSDSKDAGKALLNLPLSTVGFEVDGRFIWVYQETPLIADISALSIINNALRDIWSEQVNLLNVEYRDSSDAENEKVLVRSLVFQGSLGAQVVLLD